MQVKSQTYNGKGSCCYSSIIEQTQAKGQALYYAVIDALINSGYWYVKDVNGRRIFYSSQVKKNKTYFLYDIQKHTAEYLSKETIFSKVIIIGDPEYNYEQRGCFTSVIAEVTLEIPEKKIIRANKPKGKMRSYIGIGSFGYCWKMDADEINSENWYTHIYNNGIYATLGRFKFGSKFFAVSLDLLGYEQNSRFHAAYINRGLVNGENSLDSADLPIGDYTLKIQKLSVLKLTWQYDFHLYSNNYKHFSPYKFVISPYISVLPIEINFTKMPFAYYTEKYFNCYEKKDENAMTSFSSFFKTFEAGVKIKSSLYEFTVGYNWNYINKDFIQNYTKEDFGPSTILSSKDVDLAQSYFYVKLAICFDWNIK